jgi:Flp pilus assembly protein TadG
MVEFAIVLVVLMTLLLGIMDFSRLLYTYHHVSNAAREGTRWAVLRGASWTATCSSPWATSFGCKATASDVQSYVRSITPLGINSNSLTVTTTWPGTRPTGVSCGSTTNNPGCVVQVKLTYAYNFLFPFISRTTWNLSSTSQMVILQ